VLDKISVNRSAHLRAPQRAQKLFFVGLDFRFLFAIM
jgi:hypothetical protein